MSRTWETFALLDYGDHGLGAARRDPRRAGYLEVGHELRWIPGEGEGWRLRTAEITVRSPAALMGFMFDGVEIEHPRVGRVRIRPMSFAAGTPMPRTEGGLGDARLGGKLRKLLLRHGATEATGDAATEPPLY